jgi:hypothetical protein
MVASAVDACPPVPAGSFAFPPPQNTATPAKENARTIASGDLCITCPFAFRLGRDHAHQFTPTAEKGSGVSRALEWHEPISRCLGSQSGVAYLSDVTRRFPELSQEMS